MNEILQRPPYRLPGPDQERHDLSSCSTTTWSLRRCGADKRPGADNGGTMILGCNSNIITYLRRISSRAEAGKQIRMSSKLTMASPLLHHSPIHGRRHSETKSSEPASWLIMNFFRTLREPRRPLPCSILVCRLSSQLK